MMRIKNTRIYRFSIPMVPFTIATGTMEYAQNVLIRVFTDNGLVGIGECSAFPMICGETQDTCMELAKDFATCWKDKPALDITERMLDLNQLVTGNYTIKSAFDMALFDLAAKDAGLPLYKFLGGTYVEPESDLTIAIATPGEMAIKAADFVNNRQVNILKVKLGTSAGEDINRIREIRKAIGNDIPVRIDVNQGWDLASAMEALSGMANFNIQFCEQPMPRALDDQLPFLRSKTNIPLMADESVFDHKDALRLITSGSCDYINIKLSKAGGIQEALKIHGVCAAARIPNMLGGMLETRVALSANVHLALACPNIRFYDLDTCLMGHLEDPVINGVQFEGMRLKLPDLPGIGADADPEFLNKCEQYEV